MNDRKFKCKNEQVPVLAGFMFYSFEKDKTAFIAYSPKFNDPFLSNANAQQKNCLELVRATDITRFIKKITSDIDTTVKEVKSMITYMEGHIKLSKNELDIRIDDIGIKAVRQGIRNSNVESICAEARAMIINVKRNNRPLRAAGMKDEDLDTLIALVEKLEQLNTTHNDTQNERSRTSDDGTKELNALWDTMHLIQDAARAIYKGKNEVKLAEYTITKLLKRVHNSKPNADDKKEDAEVESTTAE